MGSSMFQWILELGLWTVMNGMVPVLKQKIEIKTHWASGSMGSTSGFNHLQVMTLWKKDGSVLNMYRHFRGHYSIRNPVNNYLHSIYVALGNVSKLEMIKCAERCVCVCFVNTLPIHTKDLGICRYGSIKNLRTNSLQTPTKYFIDKIDEAERG